MKNVAKVILIYTFKKFKYKNLRAYNNLYVLTDTILLADIFAHYRIKNYNTYGLDPISCIIFTRIC